MSNNCPALAHVDKCTGCTACAAACRIEAISMLSDAMGFLYPIVDELECVGCGACTSACPELRPITKAIKPIVTYACWDKDERRRMEATSGGAFMLLADFVIEQGGLVCGAVLNDQLEVVHVVTRDRREVERMRGSKYVQSDVRNAFRDCLNYLRAGELILFAGTSCQVAAMRIATEKISACRLISVEILCHGAPSPLFWKEYLRYREKEANDRAIDVRFRKKTPSWTMFSLELTFETEHRHQRWCTKEDPYLRAFLGDFISRQCCHECRYAGIDRVGDITLADFWGYVSDKREFRNDEKGISLVMVNTASGKEAFAAIAPKMKVVEKSIEEAAKGNEPLRNSIPANRRKEQFWNDFLNGGLEAVRCEYLTPAKHSMKHKLSLFFNDHAYLLPVKLREMMIKVRENTKH